MKGGREGKRSFLLYFQLTKYEQVERSQSGKDVSEAAPQKTKGILRSS